MWYLVLYIFHAVITDKQISFQLMAPIFDLQKYMFQLQPLAILGVLQHSRIFTALLHELATVIFKKHCTVVMWLVDLNGFVSIFYQLRPTNHVTTLYMFFNIVINKPYNNTVCSFNTVAVWGWLQVVAKTCRSTFVNQILVKLLGNKLVYVFVMGECSNIVVKALRYKPAGRGFDSRWCHWNFSVT